MMSRLLAFLQFWYDFVVGDDWRIAVGVVAALALTYGLGAVGVPSWWLLPVAVGILLPLSLLRVARSSRGGGAVSNTG